MAVQSVDQWVVLKVPWKEMMLVVMKVDLLVYVKVDQLVAWWVVLMVYL